MPKVVIDLPSRLPFVFERPLEAVHCNAFHMDNLQLLVLVTEVREALWRQLGYGGGGDIAGLGSVLADAAVVYRSEAFEGEVLRIAITCSAFTQRGCEVLWCATERDSGREVARGKWGMVFFDFSERRAAAVPPGFRAHFEPA